MNKLDLLKQLRANQLKRDEWFEKLPSDINMAFMDNEYVIRMQSDIDNLIRAVFGDNAEDAFWFLYEFKHGYRLTDNDIEYTFDNDEQFYEYFAKLVN